MTERKLPGEMGAQILDWALSETTPILNDLIRDFVAGFHACEGQQREELGMVLSTETGVRFVRLYTGLIRRVLAMGPAKSTECGLDYLSEAYVRVCKERDALRINAKILLWFATGECGVSSKAIACVMVGAPIKEPGFGCHPHDPDDFNRCLKLLQSVPEIRPRLHEMKGVSEEWSAIVDHWQEIEDCFLHEAGFDWMLSTKAPRTYLLMQEVFTSAKGAER